MKATIFIILLLTLITSCGKRATSKRNGVIVQPVQDQSFYYLTCSHIQVQQNCLDLSSNQIIAPRFFYYRGCYESYTNCLRSNGVNL